MESSIIYNNIQSKSISSSNLEYSDNNYYKFEITGLKNRITKYAFGLDKIIPWEKNNFVFAGGLLYDAVIDRNDNIDSLSDIDLFFYGTNESKLNTFGQILLNLDSNNFNYLVGVNKSVVYIFIQNIPRIIQLIFTNKYYPQEIIDTFDLTHVQTYWDGNNFYCKPIAFEQFITRKTESNYKTKPSRLIKYLRRGVDTSDILYSDWNFILDSKQVFDLAKHHKQTELYNLTNNLTTKENINEFELHLSLSFWCKILDKKILELISINTLENLNVNLNIDLIGNINNYLDIEGEFEQKPCELDFYDDLLVFKKQRHLNRIMYETQRYVYIPCQIIDKYDTFKPKVYLEITKPRVIDYLIGLSDDLEQDLSKLLNPLNNEEFKYKFTHHFNNSTTFPEMKSDVDFIFNTCGLVIDCIFKQDDFNKYNKGDKLYILFDISIYSINDGYRVAETMFGFKLKPYIIEKIN